LLFVGTIIRNTCGQSARVVTE